MNSYRTNIEYLNSRILALIQMGLDMRAENEKLKAKIKKLKTKKVKK